MQLISELGTDMSKWKDQKHFVSWLNLSPTSIKNMEKRALSLGYKITLNPI